MKTDRTFTSILRDLAENSSVHGIPKTVSSKQKPVKVLWCLLFLGTFTVFGLQLYNLFSAYYSWPVQTTVSLKFSPLRYPAVTFCNMNPVKLTKIDSYPTLKDAINPKVKKKVETVESPRRRKRGAPNPSTVLFTSMSEMPTSYESMPMQATSYIMPTSTIAESMPAQSSTIAESMPGQSSTYDKSVLASQTQGNSFVVTSPVVGTSEDVSIQGVTSLSLSENVVFTDSGGFSSISPSSADTWGSGSGPYHYDYSYDYWGSYWDDWDPWYDDYYYNSTDYYESSYATGYLGQYYSGYDENYETDYGISSFVHDQLFARKDKWDERVVNFQAKFKNETLASRELMGHKVKDMVISASFSSSLQNESKFEQVTTTQYGNCYTMTSPKYIAMRSGPTHGIKLTLNLEMDEYIKNFASGYGIRIVFHEPGTFPLPADEGMTLSPGYETSIGLRMVRVSRLGQPHGHCSDGKEFYNKYKIRYSVTACMMFCRITKTIQNCNCIPSDSPDLNFTHKSVDICFSKKDKKCQLAVDLSFDEASAVEKCDCISPCKEIVYQKTMSGRRWPNDDYLENVLMGDICSRNISSMTTACSARTNKTFDPNKYRYNFLRVLIYFEDLNYESIDQEPLYESVRFLSDIGGAMGLFMGASLLSFVEILQLILEMVLYMFRAHHPMNSVQTFAKPKERKDSLFPVPEKIRPSVYGETIRNPSPDPHAVQE